MSTGRARRVPAPSRHRPSGAARRRPSPRVRSRTRDFVRGHRPALQREALPATPAESDAAYPGSTAQRYRLAATCRRIGSVTARPKWPDSQRSPTSSCRASTPSLGDVLGAVRAAGGRCRAAARRRRARRGAPAPFGQRRRLQRVFQLGHGSPNRSRLRRPRAAIRRMRSVRSCFRMSTCDLTDAAAERASRRARRRCSTQ